MAETPRKNRKLRWTYVLALSLPVLVLLTCAGYRVYCVAALQNAVVWAKHIGIGKAEDLDAGTGWDDEVIDYVAKQAYKYSINFPWSSRERLRAILHPLSRVEVIRISDPEGFSPEFGTALARFPHLRVFGFYNPGTVPEEDLAMLFAELRQSKHLETLELHGSITHHSFALLTGHPNIRGVKFVVATITPEIAATLKTFPNLKDVKITTLIETTPTTQQVFQESLSGVKVEFERF
ncbi:hypothetical protein [Roseimicrobium sp. ORNL1]|uniref:hypothetical protein n=1 Tax=Roseimicrobium sp. ORNL1 TaxID=2711231 RepID=UPI0013E104BE|nr:hypothetical protein [Roseimicrobium sp. ORNL1]QIF03362.1 hypothetical protein G5S37_18135 [Roseimicrobium sp. ORNL1]